MLNRVIIMGRLTADPELRQTPSGVSTCRITVAVDRSFAKQGEERQADFITVVAWRQTAEFICRYFGKGRMICVEGNLRTSSYQDKTHSDITHYVMEVYAEHVNFTGEKATENGTKSNAMVQNTQSQQFTPPTQNVAQNAAQTVSAAPANTQQFAPMQGAQIDLNGFEEVINDNDLPF